jgi:medium-chain acyl-[acyl-carrier-protein] hydrolase
MSSSTISSPWLLCPRPNRRALLRLFCFPYAGGGASIFRAWPERLSASVEVCAVQLPGRANRLGEPPVTCLQSLAQSLTQALRDYLDKPFAFFGHSLGAILGFEAARHLRKEYDLLPTHLMVSGARAPHVLRVESPTYDLPESAFLEELRRLNGTPAEALANDELMRLMLPLLRADFALVQTYKYRDELPLACPITAFGGRQDPGVEQRHLQYWAQQTTARFSLHLLPGDHFFLRSAESALLEIISIELNRPGNFLD